MALGDNEHKQILHIKITKILEDCEMSVTSQYNRNQTFVMVSTATKASFWGTVSLSSHQYNKREKKKKHTY